MSSKAALVGFSQGEAQALMNLVLAGFLGSLAAGAMTTVGALPVLFGQVVRRTTTDALLGFAAGVMLAASFFSLLVPAIEISSERYGTVCHRLAV